VQEQVVRHDRGADDRDDHEQRARIGKRRDHRPRDDGAGGRVQGAGQVRERAGECGQRGKHREIERVRPSPSDEEDRVDRQESGRDGNEHRQIKEQLRAEHDAGELGDVGGDCRDLKRAPEGRRGTWPARGDQRREVAPAGDRQSRDRSLQHDRDDVRREDHPQQPEAVGAGRQVRGPVARIDVADAHGNRGTG
jgi:hypothetical protein